MIVKKWKYKDYNEILIPTSLFQHELFNILGGNLQKVDATSQKDEGYEELQRCFSNNITSTEDSCICSRQVWINWYPCALKYCRNHEGDGEHRCGIKTCQKCLTFRYRAKSKLHCSWDEPWLKQNDFKYMCFELWTWLKFILNNKVQNIMVYQSL